MLAVRCNSWMPYQNLKIEDVPLPALGSGQVRIAVHYAGVAFSISLMTQGRYQRKPPLPFTPGAEVSGTIAEVAPDVVGLALGDRVCARLEWGGHAEQAVTEANNVYRIPDSLPFDLAPQFPVSYGTSYAALAWRAQVQAGETVLIHGAAGAVGLAAVELAKAMGCRVIAAASTQAKCDLATAHGADQAVAFPDPTALDVIRSFSPAGVDAVFDPIGGDAFDLSLRSVTTSGRILLIGFAGGRIQQIPANILLVKNVTVMGFDYGKYSGSERTDKQTQHDIRVAMRQMFDWYVLGTLRPVTSHRFPLRDFATAMDTVLARASMGKVVLEMPLARSCQT
jgi:NADPH2:quinone reductase